MSLHSPPAPNPLIPLGITLLGCFVTIGAMITENLGLIWVGMFLIAVPWLIYLSAHWRHSRAYPAQKRRSSGDRRADGSGGWFMSGGDTHSGGVSHSSGDSCSSGDSGGGDCGGGGGD